MSVGEGTAGKVRQRAVTLFNTAQKRQQREFSEVIKATPELHFLLKVQKN